MSGVSSTGSSLMTKASRSRAVDAPSTSHPPVNTAEPTDLLPPAFTAAVTDDFATSLALMTLQQKHEDRVQNDASARAAVRTQEEAQARKIEKMHELADDTFIDAVVDGVTEGVSAVATGLSACVKFQGETKLIDAKQVEKAVPGIDMNIVERAGNRLIRNASLIEATGGGVKAAGKFAQAAYKHSQELDRADMAVADQDIDRAKGSADAASTQARRDEDDMRDTINAIRSYSNAKTQLQQSAIIRG